MSSSFSIVVAAHAAHPPAADHEVLHRRRQLVLGDAEQVGVGVVGQHERALLEHGVDRLEPVAVDGRPPRSPWRRDASRIRAVSSCVNRWSPPDMNATKSSTIARCSSIVTFIEHGPPQRPIWPGKHGRPVAIAFL